MMRFVSEIADHETGLSRQVFRDPKLELFIWWDRNATHSRKDVIRGFELHYAINTPDEWSIRWTEKEGTSFHRVDTHGADPSDVNNTPPDVADTRSPRGVCRPKPLPRRGDPKRRTDPSVARNTTRRRVIGRIRRHE